MLTRYYRAVRLCTLLVVATAIAAPQVACGRVTLISAYDEQIDHSATELQRRMDAFLTMLADKAGSPEAEYQANRSFYSEYAVDLRSVKVRAESHPKNGITVQQLDLMSGSLEELRKSHEDAPIAPEAAATFLDLFNQGWGAIITLELAKRRGETPSEE